MNCVSGCTSQGRRTTNPLSELPSQIKIVLENGFGGLGSSATLDLLSRSLITNILKDTKSVSKERKSLDYWFNCGSQPCPSCKHKGHQDSPHLSQVKMTSLDLRAPGSVPPIIEGKRRVLVSGSLQSDCDGV
jgi:hypothetical protein